jgi:NADH dehydrogenase (ubiquinone) Fe-S protein 3
MQLFNLSLDSKIVESNFDSISPWEQVGAGTKGRRPEDLKPLPPPKPEEVKK